MRERVLDESDIGRELRTLVERSADRPLPDLAPHASFKDLGIDGLALAHLRYHVQEAFHVDIGGARTPAEALARIEKQAYWTYPAPPGAGALDRARGDFWQRLLRPPVHLGMRSLARVGFHYRVEGRRHVPRSGPFVLVSNHAGHADAPALMAALPLARVNDTHPLAAHDYFFTSRRREAPARLFVNALPIDRRAHVDEAMHDALALLREGRGLILFPEGTRSPDGRMQPFKKGIGFLAAGKPWPVVPAHVEGSRDVLPKGARTLRFARLRVRIGAPRRYDDRPDTREEWARIARELEKEMRALGA